MVLAVWPCAAIVKPKAACGAELLIDDGSGDVDECEEGWCWSVGHWRNAISLFAIILLVVLVPDAILLEMESPKDKFGGSSCPDNPAITNSQLGCYFTCQAKGRLLLVDISLLTASRGKKRIKASQGSREVMLFNVSLGGK
ncbi:hypothetical protein B0H65DRAFT_439339 [Neurospora tetraspora]|uniref:Uncharacterized protein n=1 Tax=Neurospora tetraspora TaxID=94610 RepID=A0AAE0JR58_9PEZI|nr:hypothetical protein B0H65DRAFT_439339 [Neurospora tetraspora]